MEDEKKVDVATPENLEAAVEKLTGKLVSELTRSVKAEIAELNKTRSTIIVGDDNTIDNKTGGWSSFTHYFSDLMIYGKTRGQANPVISDELKNWVEKSDLIDNHLRAVTGANVTADTAGGNLVPTDYATYIDELFIQESIVMQHGNKVPMGTETMYFPQWGDHDHSGGAHAGATPQMGIAEGGEYLAQKFTFRKKLATLKKFGMAMPYTVEVDRWSAPSVVALISQIAPMAIATEYDFEAFNGLGSVVTEPIREAACRVKVSGEITVTNINYMWARQLNKQKAIWIFPDTPAVFNALQTLSLGGTANASPIYLPGNNIAGAPFGTIYGRPVMFTENWNDIDGGGFIDFSSVYIPTGGGIEQYTSEDIRFMFDEKVVKFTMYADCLPIMYEPHTPRNGSDDKSVIVLLSDGTEG